MKLVLWIQIKLVSLIWKFFPSKLFFSIHRFSLVEYDSCWQLLNAISNTTNPQVRAHLFLNAVEELKHGQLFEQTLNSLSDQRIVIEIPARRPIVMNQSEFENFLIYFHIGETLVYKKFEWLSDICNEPLKSVLKKISSDERKHGPSMFNLLEETNFSKSHAKFLFFKNKLFRLSKILIDSLKKFDHPIYFILGLIYYIAGLFVYRSLKLRFYLDRNEQLKIFEDQITQHAIRLKNL